MRSGIRIYAASLVVIGLMLGAFVSISHADVEAVKDTTWTTWPNTIYYMAHLSGPDGPYDDITIKITAVDEYKLYVNGTMVGTDSDWQTVETYTVTAGTSDIRLGVEVKNSGTGLGNGLMVDIQAGADWLGTTTLKRRSAVKDGTRKIYPCMWWYYAGDITKTTWGGANWYNLNYNAGKSETFLNDTNIQAQLRQCILGSMGEISYRPDPHIEIITGYPGNIDLGTSENGGIQLRRIDGENIALGKPAQEDRLTDGDPTNTFFAYNQDPLGSWRYVDLERIYRINRFVLFTGGQDPNTWVEKSVRGFAVDISLDKFRWEEVNVIHEIGVSNADNGDYDYASVDFPDEWARYARFRITEPRDQFPNIGDIMIYGVGYAYSGQFESEWLDFGLTNVQKNFKTVVWEGSAPEGTSITFQIKTAYRNTQGNLVESPWGKEFTTKDIPVQDSEPASMIKYRVKLTTQDINKTPVLESVKFSYSEENQPVSIADGFVLPNSIPMGVDTDFVYTLSYNLNSGENISALALATPGYAVINNVHSSDTKSDLTVDNGGLLDIKQTSPDTLWVHFATPITDTNNAGPDSLYITFNTKLLRNIHNFNAWVYNDKNNDDAGGLGVWENRDLGSWTVLTSTITKGVLSEVKAVPKVFTPNGDGINDFTVIEFSLSKITAKMKIKIFDTRGGLVTTIFDDRLEPRPWFVPNKLGNTTFARNMPGYWDGTDEDGDLVPPGVYLYQVVAETDDGDKVESGTVVVGY